LKGRKSNDQKMNAHRSKDSETAAHK
jgi:hypothetical protein